MSGAANQFPCLNAVGEAAVNLKSPFFTVLTQANAHPASLVNQGHWCCLHTMGFACLSLGSNVPGLCSCQVFLPAILGQWSPGITVCGAMFSHLPEWDKEEPLKTMLRFLEAGFSFGRGWRQTPSLGCELMALTEHNRGTCHAHY